MNRIAWGVSVAALATTLLAGCAADRLHSEGLADLDKGNYEQGIDKLSQAATAAPQNLSYKLDLAARRDAAVQKLIAAGDSARASGDLAGATGSYRRVLLIDAGNERALSGLEGLEADRRHADISARAKLDLDHKDYDAADAKLRSVLDEDPTYTPALSLREKLTLARGPVSVAPRLQSANDNKVTLEFRDAPTKMVFEVLARQTGINFILDKDVKTDTKTTIFVQNVPVEQAIDLVLDQNGLAREVMSNNMVLIYPNTTTKQKDYEEQIVRTFYISNAAPKDVEGLLKSVLGAKTLYVDERSSTVVMRDTPDVIRMAEKLVASIDVPEPEVMMEVEVLEISRSQLQNLGVSYPNSVTATLNPVTNSAGLVVADLHKQTTDSVTLSSLSATLNILKNSGLADTLASPRIRARNKEKAKILIGSRVPVITNSVTPTATSAVVTGSVQYLDVGLTLNVQPTVYDDGDVAIKVDMEVSSITNQITTPSGTVAYTIGTRNADTLLRLKDGETQILAGLIQDSDTRSASGIPGFSDIPVLGRLFGSHNTDREKSEIVLSITPRIIRAPAHASSENTEFWYGTETRPRSAPTSYSGGSGAAPAAAAAASAPPVAGGVSGGAGAGVVSAGATEPADNAHSAQAIKAAIATPQGPPPKADLTLSGPGEVHVGDEFTVNVDLQSEPVLNHLRAQVRYDTGTLQLEGADNGGLVPESASAKITTPVAGGAMLDASATDTPLGGSGTLMVLHFKALKSQPVTAVSAQLAVVGAAGTAQTASTPSPLTLAVAAN